MSATIVIAQNYGQAYGSPAEVAKNIFYLIDADSGLLTSATNPIQVPTSGTNYSCEVWLRARCDVAPAVKVFNIKAWYDSGIPTPGYTLTVNSSAVASYSAPVNTLSSIGTRVDFTTKTSSSNYITVAGALTTVGDYSDYLVFQLEVASTATPTEATINWTLEFDEV